MDYRRSYDYPNGCFYGTHIQGYPGAVPYDANYQNYGRSSQLYTNETMGQMPFYHAMQDPMYDDREAQEERDIAYMKEMYPAQVKEIMRQVEEMCDRMDYEGSMMYDEYPDRIMLQRLCRQIYDKVSYLDTTTDRMLSPETQETVPAPMPIPVPADSVLPETPDMPVSEDVTAMQCENGRCNPCRGRNCNPFQDLIEVLLYQEMQRRRHRRRNRRRYW